MTGFEEWWADYEGSADAGEAAQAAWDAALASRWPSPPEAAVEGDRGFLTYLGRPLMTTYGHEITVRESSAAVGPHVWLFIDTLQARKMGVTSGDPHLNLVQAIGLRMALEQFITGVAERWQGGERMLAEALAMVIDAFDRPEAEQKMIAGMTTGTEEERKNAWDIYFAGHPDVRASYSHQNGGWPPPESKED
ncbi:MAG TPA: hypothetical protein VGL32_02080 [Acidimicrobiales bacterium]|jgi:hypothetical protein